MKTVLLIVASSLLWVTLVSYAQAQAPGPISSPTPPTQNNEEAIALKAQVELMRHYDQRLLNTVYWALGGMGAVVLLVVGLGWYTNFRLYKRDVEDLKKDADD